MKTGKTIVKRIICIRIVILTFLGLSFLPVLSQVNLTNGLVAYYPFSGNANDATGNGHNGVLVNGGPTLTSDRFGNPNSAYFFDGVDDYIKIIDNGAFSTNTISISLWFKTNSDVLQNLIGKRFFGDDGTPAGGAQYQFFINYAPFPGIGSNLVGNNNTCADITNPSSYINTGNVICKSKWYHAVVTFDGVTHKIYIDGVLKLSSNTGFTGMISCISELRFGVWWQGGTLPFSGIMDDIRWYNRALNQAEVTALYDNFPTSSSADFSYSQNPCTPKTVQFSNITPGTTSISWDFGNSTTNTGNQNPIVNYANYGTYPVKLKVQTSAGCVDSTVKLIQVNLVQDSLITVADTSICRGTSITLNTLPSLNFCWQSAPGLSSTSISNPVATPTANTTYYFTSQSMGTNLVTNGDFAGGNTGFQSNYTSIFPNSAATMGRYWVGNNPSTWGGATFPACGDHTTGTGNMLMVNGSTTLGAKVWQQSINVIPNTNYTFSIWVKPLDPLSGPVLKFAINDNQVGNYIVTNSVTCIWHQFFVTWNSGSNTAATIAILDYNSVFARNNFALDDISFAQVFLKQDSVKISLTDPPTLTITPNTSICPGDTLQLNVSGAGNFTWSPSLGLTNASVSNPKASPSGDTKYIVTGYDLPGCTAKDSVTITVKPKPAITRISDTSFCNGGSVTIFANSPGATNYLWSPAAGLSSTSVNNPQANPTSSTKYFVEVTGANGCKNTDSVKVDVLAVPVVDTRIDTAICNGTQLAINTVTSGATGYSWSPATGLSDATIANPLASPTVLTKYIITAFNTACSAKDSVTIDVLSGPVLSKSNDTAICREGQAQLFASGANTYTWSGAGLSATVGPNTTASPTSPTTYYVIGTGSNGCSTKDSVAVSFKPKPTITKISDTSLCVGSPITIFASSPGATNYVWSPAAGLSSTSVNNPQANPTSSTKYFVEVTGANTCKNTDSVKVDVLAVPVVDTRVDTAICNGTDITLNTNSSGATSYSWSPSTGLSNAGVASPLASPTILTKYIITASNTACSAKDSVTVDILSGPVLSKSNDTSICVEGQAYLFASGAVTYAWSPSAGLSSIVAPNPTASPLVPTKYYVVGTGANTCTTKDSISVSFKPKPAITKISDTSLCVGSSITIFANSPGATNYVWSPSPGLSSTSVNNPQANPTTSTKYFVEVTGANTCKNTDSVRVDVLAVPTVDTRIDTSICNGTQIILNTITSGATSYSWSPSTGLSNTGVASPVASPTVLTKYIITASNTACSAKDSVTLSVLSLPVITKSNDTTICNQGQAQLFVSGASTYTWSGAGLSATVGPNPTASPSSPTTYYVAATGANGCVKTDSIKVNWIPKPVFSVNPPAIAICTGDTTLLTASGADTYNWYSGSNILSPGTGATQVHPNTTQQYNVAVHHNFCRITDTLHATVTVNSLPAVTVSKSNDIDCSNASATLSASGGSTYSWTPLIGISGANSPTPVVSPPVNTTYTVKVTSVSGCVKYDSVRVLVAFNPATGGYNMPDAFTPNNDGKNDCLGLKYWGTITQLDFSVYNRWGEVVFHTNNPSACWDGTYKGIPQATGTFVYQIRAKTGCGDVYKKGTIILMR